MDPRSRFRTLVTDPQIGDGLRRVVRRFLRKQNARAVDEAALRHRLPKRESRRQRQEKDENRLHCRRMACNVKSSSFSGTLYWSFSSVRRVRLPRATSTISSCRAVQMPWMF